MLQNTSWYSQEKSVISIKIFTGKHSLLEYLNIFYIDSYQLFYKFFGGISHTAGQHTLHNMTYNLIKKN